MAQTSLQIAQKAKRIPNFRPCFKSFLIKKPNERGYREVFQGNNKKGKPDQGIDI
jgi:hypothetical protein